MPAHRAESLPRLQVPEGAALASVRGSMRGSMRETERGSERESQRPRVSRLASMLLLFFRVFHKNSSCFCAPCIRSYTKDVENEMGINCVAQKGKQKGVSTATQLNGDGLKRNPTNPHKSVLSCVSAFT